MKKITAMPQKIRNKFKLRDLKFNYVTDIDSKHPNFQVRLSTFLYLTQFMRNSCKKMFDVISMNLCKKVFNRVGVS